MLYYIIPPVVIVISLSFLVGFLFKKSNELRDVIESEQQAIIERKEKKFSQTGSVMLKILERIMQKFKLLSLKFYNHSDQWFQSLKQKREKRLLESKKLEAEQYREVERNVVDAVAVNSNQERRNKFESFFRKSRRIDNINIEPEVKKPVAPMISQRVVQPESKVQKNMLEDILIERIAINPRDVEAYERLGDYYIEVNNLTDSMECFKQVIKLSPTNRKAKSSLRKIEKILAR